MAPLVRQNNGHPMNPPFSFSKSLLPGFLSVFIAIPCCVNLLPGRSFGAGITPPSPTDEGRALLKARAYHLAMERFLQVQEKSESAIERAQALKLIGETQFYEKDYASAYQAYQQ